MPAGKDYRERLSTLQTEGIPEKLGLLIVHGKNIGKCWNPKDIRSQRFHLSPHSRMNVLAAGILYNMGLTDKILFSGGKTAGKYFPSEAEAMKIHLKRIFPKIPDYDILLEEESLSTWEMALNLRESIKSFEKVGVISPGFHIPRVEYLFQKAGVEILGIPSENALAVKRPKIAKAYKNSRVYSEEIRREIRVYFIQQHAEGRLLDDFLAGKRRDPFDEAQAA